MYPISPSHFWAHNSIPALSHCCLTDFFLLVIFKISSVSQDHQVTRSVYLSSESLKCWINTEIVVQARFDSDHSSGQLEKNNNTKQTIKLNAGEFWDFFKKTSTYGSPSPTTTFTYIESWFGSDGRKRQQCYWKKKTIHINHCILRKTYSERSGQLWSHFQWRSWVLKRPKH